jgi:hypothetical protein
VRSANILKPGATYIFAAAAPGPLPLVINQTALKSESMFPQYSVNGP